MKALFAAPPATAILVMFFLGLAVGAAVAYFPGPSVDPVTRYPGILAFVVTFALIGGTTNFTVAVLPPRMKLFHALFWILAGIVAFPVAYIPTYLLLAT